MTTVGGRRFWLGVPVDGGIMPDPDLAAKLAQIRDYWHTAATGSPEGVVAPVWWLREDRGTGAPLGAGPGRGPKVLAAITAPWVLLSCALVFAIAISPFTLRDISPAWSAHLGHGQPGTFAAVTENCDRTCSWYGDFTARSGYTRTNVLFGSGNHITQAGEQAAAVDTGDPKVVYPAGGGSDWIWATAIAAAQLVTVTCVPIYLVRKVRRRMARQSPPGVPGRADNP